MTLKELKQKMLKDYLERNMSMLDDNIEIGIKESIFICRHFFATTGAERDFWKSQ